MKFIIKCIRELDDNMISDGEYTYRISEPATLIIRQMKTSCSVDLSMFNNAATLSKNGWDSFVTKQQSLDVASFSNCRFPRFRIVDNIVYMPFFCTLEKPREVSPVSILSNSSELWVYCLIAPSSSDKYCK